MFKMNIHSAVDVITNSSTVIYTRCEGSIAPAKQVIDEFLKAFNITGTADDLFYIDTFLDDAYMYEEYICEYWNSEQEEEDQIDVSIVTIKWLEEQIKSVLRGGKTPDWMDSAVDHYEENSTCLYIEAKNPEHQKIGDRLVSFLNSSESEEAYG